MKKITAKVCCMMLAFFMLLTATPVFADDAQDVSEALTFVKAEIESRGAISESFDLFDSYNGVSLTYATASEYASIDITGATPRLIVEVLDLNARLSVSLDVTGSKGGASLTEAVNFKIAIENCPTAPEANECIFYEDFSGPGNTFIGGGSTVTSGSGAHEITNDEKWKVTPSGGGVNLWFIDANTPITPTTGYNTVFEYDVEYNPLVNNASSGAITTYFTSSNSNSYMPISSYFYENLIQVHNGSTSTTFSSGNTTGLFPLGGRLRMTYVVKYTSISTGTFDMYANGIKLASNLAFRNNYDIRGLRINAPIAAGSAYFNSVKVYNVLPDIDPVKVTTPPSKTIFDFPLDLTSGGNSITWLSNNPAITINGGTAKVNPIAEAKNVTLTAYTVFNGIKYFKTFTVSVSADQKPPMIGDPNVLGDYIFYEDFSGPGKTFVSSGSTTVVSGGKQEITNDGKWKVTPDGGSVNLFFINSTTAIQPTPGYRTAFEFDVECDPAENAFTTNQVNIYYGLASGNSGSISSFLREDRLGLYNGAASNTFQSSTTAGLFPLGGRVRITYVVDYTSVSTGSIDMYANGIKLASNFDFRYQNEIRGFRLQGAANVGSFYFNNVKVYNVELADEKKVDTDHAALTAGGFAAINSLPQELVEEDFSYTPAKGSSIKFSSVPAGLVNSNGTINLPNYSTKARVTATVYIGSYEKSVSYDCVIAGKTVICELDESYSGWEINDYYAFFPAYTLDSENHSVWLIIAAYEGDSIAELSIEEVTVYPKGTENPDWGVEDYIGGILGVPSKTGTTKVKAMVWGDMNSMKPLVEAPLK